MLQSWLNPFFKLAFFHRFVAFLIRIKVIIALLLRHWALLKCRVPKVYVLKSYASPCTPLTFRVWLQISDRACRIAQLSKRNSLFLHRQPHIPWSTARPAIKLKLYGLLLTTCLQEIEVALGMLILHNAIIGFTSLLELHAFATDQLTLLILTPQALNVALAFFICFDQ